MCRRESATPRRTRIHPRGKKKEQRKDLPSFFITDEIHTQNGTQPIDVTGPTLRPIVDFA